MSNPRNLAYEPNAIEKTYVRQRTWTEFINEKNKLPEPPRLSRYSHFNTVHPLKISLAESPLNPIPIQIEILEPAVCKCVTM